MGRVLRGVLTGVVAGASLLVPLTVAVVTAPSAAAAPPANTPARTGVPANIYAIGDSITTATGTAALGDEHPANSWVTGTNPSSFPDGRGGSPNVLSMRHRLGIVQGSAVNLANNGKRMQDFDDQANQLPSTAQYVVVELGGNDLCRPSVAEMTTEASYRASFRAGLEAVADRAPGALVFVASIPDIYNLWWIRGHNDDQTGQAGRAHFFWDNFTGFEIPCESLLTDPTTMGGAAETRRRQARTRNMAFNQILAEECSAVLRCRFDGFGFFARSSNRVDPFSNTSAYLPRADWWFEDRDVSHNQGTWNGLCPVNFSYSGCGDHFHPSHWGLAKLALAGHELSYQFLTDDTAPTRTTAVSRPPDANGVYAGPVDVSFGGTDANGVRGQEVRAVPDGSAPGPWVQHIGLAPPVTISAIGTTHVQVRTLDQNGNISSSTTRTVTIDPSQFGDLAGTVTGPSGPLQGIQVSLHEPGSAGAQATTTTGPDGSYAFDDLLASADVKVRAHDPTGVHLDGWFDGASTHAAATAVDVPSGGSTTADLSLALTPGTVAGTVTGPGGPVEGVEVSVHAAGTEGEVASATTGGDGTYSVELVPGTYRLRFSDPSGVHLDEWHQDAAGHGSGADVTVTKEQTTSVDAVLALTPGSIEGTVSGPGGPVEGLSVVAVAGGAEAAGEPVTADAGGEYEITGLLPGAYTVTVAPVECAWLGTGGPAEVPTAGGSDTVDLDVVEEPPGPHGLLGVPAWVEEAVRWLVDDCNDPQHMTGLPDGSFGTDLDITRGQALRALWRIQGQPASDHAHGFSDVPGWIEDAVQWATELGYMTGYPDDTFRADASISRGQIARLLFRLEGMPDNGGLGYDPHGLTDVGAWIEDAVRWLVAEGHATGINGSFQQDAPITRGQFARMAYRVST